LLPILISLSALVVSVEWAINTSNLAPLAKALSGLSWQTSAVVFALFVTAAMLASVRLWFIARDIRSPISPLDAVIALTAGSLAGAVFFQIMGQTIARSTILARGGTPVAATLIMTGYERAVALVVSLLFGLSGGAYLFGSLSFDVHGGGGELLKLITVGCLAVVAGACFAWGPLLADWLRPSLSGANAGKVVRSLAISIAIQLCTLTAYMVGALALAPNLPLTDILAASAVVMLATAIPISFAGWGIREISAVLALGAVGMSAESALVVALQVGVMSLVALLTLCALALFRKGVSPGERKAPDAVAVRPNFELALAWAIPLATSTLVFFQTYVPTAQGTKLNVNVADPLAIIAGVLFVLTAIRTKAWPSWRVSGLNLNLLLATLAMTVALAIGWRSFGWTAWAFTSKYLGWFVLLAYGLTGALLVAKTGEAGRRVMLLTFIAAGAAVGGVEVILAVLRRLGLEDITTVRASGVAANPNAFAFQMVLCACAAMVVIQSQRLLAVVLTIVLAALALSASRAGFGAGLLLIAAGLFQLPSRRWAIAIAAIVPLGLLVSYEAVQLTYQLLLPGPLAGADPNFSPVGLMTQSPDGERWATIGGGWALFQAHPLFGAGLGAFAEAWRQQHGEVQVIHSTPVWLLAEFGIVGAALIFLPFARVMLLSSAEAAEREPMAVLTFLVCLVFAVFAAVHEVAYQRAFWLILGASLTLGLVPGQRPQKISVPRLGLGKL
jgi:hypothetical protein